MARLADKNLFIRALTAIVLLAIVSGAYWFQPYWRGLLLSVYVLAIGEWITLCIHAPFAIAKRLIWLLLGLLYISGGVYSFTQFPHPWPLYLLGICIITDVSAYVCGRLWGRKKLAPTISPGKTIVGAIGGLVAMSICGALLAWLLEEMNLVHYYISIAVFLSIIAQGGDLLESYCKRQFRVKDSSHLIPGHGGVLDRLDSLLAVSLINGIFLLLTSL